MTHILPGEVAPRACHSEPAGEESRLPGADECAVRNQLRSRRGGARRPANSSRYPTLRILPAAETSSVTAGSPMYSTRAAPLTLASRLSLTLTVTCEAPDAVTDASRLLRSAAA